MNAQNPQNRDELTLRLDGPLITPEAFKKAAQAFADLVTQVSEDVAQGGKQPVWNMSVRPGSSIFVARAVADPETTATVKRTISALVVGMSLLVQGDPNVPHFNQQALYAARDLSSLKAKADTIGINSVEVATPGEAVEITPAVADIVRRTISSAHTAFGSIEGKLQTISDRNTFQFVVFDAISDKGVNCFVPEEKFQLAHSAFGKRVKVDGLISYDRNGKPLSIKVDEIRILRDLKDLPPIESFRGLLSSA